MSFREKSAWAMGAVMALTGLYYLNIVVRASRELGSTAPPTIVLAYVLFVVVSSIIVQVALALTSPKEAIAAADERELPAIDRAGHWSGLVVGVGAVTSLGYYLFYSDGNLLFHMIMGSLILSQIAEYAFRIGLFRRGIA